MIWFTITKIFCGMITETFTQASGKFA